ncbi:MAG: AMP-binding protein [Solirubrobacterales bacterium]
MSGLEALGGDETFPKLLVRNARTIGDRVAMREKEYGIWNSFTWRAYHDHVRDFSLGLVALGVKPGDKVAIIGDNRPEWVWTELAAQAAGAASVGLYQDSNVAEVAFVIDHCDASIVVAEDQEQVDKLLDMLDKLPKVRHVVFTDPRGLRKYHHPALLSFGAVEEKGRALGAEQPRLFEENVARTKADDTAIVCYTSGTTGNPKGAMLSFRNLLSMTLALDVVDVKKGDDEFVSFLPLAWIGEQMMSVSASLAKGFTVNFPEEPDTVTENIREIGPDVMFAPPRVWESMVSTVQVKIMDTTPFKRFMFERFMPIGKRLADKRFEKKPLTFGDKVAGWLADVLLFRALRDRLGMTHLRSASTGGAALGPDVFRFFHAMGVPLRQIYGQTEISGISCIHHEGDIAFHTVGKPIPGTEIKIDERGEILSRSPSVFLGYYKNPEATEATLKDGWLHSGDAGYVTEDGHLVVIDRVKDVMKLADGTQFSPQFIENRLKFSPYVKEAVVVGKDRPFLTAMLCIDMGVVGKWAEKNKLSYTTYTDLSAKKEVYDLVQRAVDEVNETLPAAARIEKFVLLYKELDADDEELTRTRKVRRVFVEQRYDEVIRALYADVHEVPIDTTIKFQDGKTSRFRTTLLVRRLAGGKHGKAA